VTPFGIWLADVDSQKDAILFSISQLPAHFKMFSLRFLQILKKKVTTQADLVEAAPAGLKPDDRLRGRRFFIGVGGRPAHSPGESDFGRAN
jgi:hypothetical protein